MQADLSRHCLHFPYSAFSCATFHLFSSGILTQVTDKHQCRLLQESVWRFIKPLRCYTKLARKTSCQKQNALIIMLAHVYSKVFGKRTMLTFYLGCRLLKNLLTAGIPTSYGWMTCYFTSVFTSMSVIW